MWYIRTLVVQKWHCNHLHDVYIVNIHCSSLVHILELLEHSSLLKFNFNSYSLLQVLNAMQCYTVYPVCSTPKYTHWISNIFDLITRTIIGMIVTIVLSYFCWIVFGYNPIGLPVCGLHFNLLNSLDFCVYIV